MAEYRISGVWKNSNNVITHYAFHTVGQNSTSRAIKKTKVEAVTLLQQSTNSASTWIWNYNRAKWDVGEEVEVVNGKDGKFLRSKPDNKVGDNLDNLIDLDWIVP